MSSREVAQALPSNYSPSTGVAQDRPRWAHQCFRQLVSMLLRVRCAGLDRLPKSSNGVLLVANHTSLIDGFLMCAFVPRPMLFCITGDFALKQPGKGLFQLLGVMTGGSYVALDPERPYGIRKVLEALKSGGTVMLFPEGKISSTGELQPLQQGLLRIIERTCAITVPVRIDGLATSSFGRAPASKRKWYPTISIVAQEPIAAGGASFQDAVRDALGG